MIIHSSTPHTPSNTQAIDVPAYQRLLRRFSNDLSTNRPRGPGAPSTESNVVDRVQSAMYDELIERLDLVRLTPGSVLCLGLPVGDYCHRLAQRYPDAQITAGTIVPEPTVPVWRRWSRLVQGRRIRQATIDPLALPFEDHSVDLVCCAWLLAWYPIGLCLEELRRVIRPGGLLVMNVPGTDTLAELREVYPTGVHPFPDVQDVGGLLSAAGFSDSVVDVDRHAITVPDAATLLRWLHDGAWSNIRSDRSRGLWGRQRWQALTARLEDRLQGSRGATVSLEVVYGHAWAPRAKAPGRVTVPFQ